MGMSFIISNANFSNENLGQVTPKGKRWFIDQTQSDLDIIATADGLDWQYSVVFSGTSAYTAKLSNKVIDKIMLPLHRNKITSSTILFIGTISNPTPTSIEWGLDKQEISLKDYYLENSDNIGEFVLINLPNPISIEDGKYLQIRIPTGDVLCGSEKKSSQISDYLNSYASLYICGGVFNRYFTNWVTPIRFYGE